MNSDRIISELLSEGSPVADVKTAVAKVRSSAGQILAWADENSHAIGQVFRNTPQDIDRANKLIQKAKDIESKLTRIILDM